jgi:dynein heavy chain
MIETIVSIQPRATGSATGKSPDDLVDEIAEKIENELP